LRTSRWDELIDDREKESQFRSRGGELVQLLRRPQHLIGIAANTGPTEVPDPVNYFGTVRTAVRQVSTVQDLVRRSELQVGENGFKGRKIAVDVR
jgi:hypothetical protein